MFIFMNKARCIAVPNFDCSAPNSMTRHADWVKNLNLTLCDSFHCAGGCLESNCFQMGAESVDPESLIQTRPQLFGLS